jgi:hypothetical protein
MVTERTIISISMNLITSTNSALVHNRPGKMPEDTSKPTIKNSGCCSSGHDSIGSGVPDFALIQGVVE